MPSHPSDEQPVDAARFEQTRWSIVVTAADGDSTKARKALEHLCTTYWYPLYAFVRREGHGAHDAQDLTQEFFARLLEKNWLNAVDREKGKFRSFLLAAMRHFLANEWDRANRLKRGGGQTLLSLDSETAESRYAIEPADRMTADRIYERRWALTMLEQVLARLRREFLAAGRERLFEELKPVMLLKARFEPVPVSRLKTGPQQKANAFRPGETEPSAVLLGLAQRFEAELGPFVKESEVRWIIGEQLKKSPEKRAKIEQILREMGVPFSPDEKPAEPVKKLEDIATKIEKP